MVISYQRPLLTLAAIRVFPADDIKKRAYDIITVSPSKNGRDERIRTSDHLDPIQVRYQTALHPVCTFTLLQRRILFSTSRGVCQEMS